MTNINNLRRQHLEVMALVNKIRNFIVNRENINREMEIAKNINILAGKLKIHLDSEDKYLYPSLLKSRDLTIKKISEDYIKEMSSICNEFMEFKDKYNTKSKLLKNGEEFIKESEIIFKLIEKRISKEDEELYNLL
ncbi:hemerythrin-like domain-containing protein [Clostridium tetanomorphum]|uniref:Hemerythrin domain-containing protein n=1 Tax=Clostridium tetanomorphum TaxID=1553 RepID=A0A923J319_CLOTT|nr:hemerythrin domain-containing protein [Clostridium tetanomorphum]KAJ51853.1 hemerythrin HHE cation binding domain-containing protein [Clostridium tetanomorphum DSM 665]MBC2399503.1 hemerythrin domain-containing protein [Clostridium tetanomorphum]MBP1864144.1 hemerythrin-like domain-containing protein [Clostridium tetanomorphum]NRS84557.1 hemerythrin-like domain-containing protein [Clostridium tetanomorphum]NRZ97771.1 hemerythrin-like domain-containing protein [Clostridium tetanomorphum]